ncbi:7822_t:CDS:1, partial [Scutellospora calospora]
LEKETCIPLIQNKDPSIKDYDMNKSKNIHNNDIVNNEIDDYENDSNNNIS